MENGQKLIINTEGFSEAQLEIVRQLREALHELQKLQLEKQTLETAVRSEKRDAERLAHRIAIQIQEIEILRGSSGGTGIATGSEPRPLDLDVPQPGANGSPGNPPVSVNAVQPIHAKGRKGSQKKAALPKCPDGTKRYCPVCLLNIHTFGFAVSPQLFQHLNDLLHLTYPCRELKTILRNIQSIILQYQTVSAV